jgi:acetyltransferase
MDTSPFQPFFSPRGIAILGVSHNPNKLGYGLARNLVQSNYPGVIHFVNPKGGHLFGRPVYPQVTEVPDPLDLAILLIPAAGIPQALLECGQRGLRAAIIASGGFRETGPQGAALEAEVLTIARREGIRLLGPNSVGIIDTHLPLDATFFSPPGPLPGDVAFISHSGAICAAVIDWARGQGFGLSRMISLGNQVDLAETDLLGPIAADPHTRVITLYLEGVSDGRRFVAEATRVTRQKPVIALKVGRFASGRLAIASHTGALAGQENAFNAAFQRAGVIRAGNSEEMFDWARALAWCPLPAGRSMAVLTNAGGPGVTAADALEAEGLHLAALSARTLAALGTVLPPAASLHNPVDMLAGATPEQYGECLRLLLDDPGVHGVLVILPPPPMHTAGAVAKALIPTIHAAEKPVVIALMGERLIQEAVEHFRAARVPEYRFPERAASALAILVQRADRLARAVASDEFAPPGATSPPLDGTDRARVRDILAGAAGSGLSQADLLHILSAYGIQVAPAGLAETPAQAARLAGEIGLPVALKVDSPDLVHKSEAGGVMLNLMDLEAIAQGFETIVERVRQARPEARIFGVQVQRMAPPGQEVIIGAVQDAQFGALAMFGAGGIEVEALGDVSFALAPLSRDEAEAMCSRTWAGRRLQGYRSLPAADREAALDVLLRLAQLAADFPQLAEIEINPLRVLPPGRGAVAVDVRGRLNKPGS